MVIYLLFGAISVGPSGRKHVIIGQIPALVPRQVHGVRVRVMSKKTFALQVFSMILRKMYCVRRDYVCY